MRYAGSKMSNFLTKGPDFADIGATGMDAASSERQTDTAAEAQVLGSGLESMAMVKEAAHQARAIEAGGMAQAAATRASGMSNMISGIAGGIGSLNFSGGGGGGYSSGGLSFSADAGRSAQNSFNSFFKANI